MKRWSDKAQSNWSIVLLVIMFAVYTYAFIRMWNRTKYGVDLTDETYYEALIYGMMRGNVLYVDSWAAQMGGGVIAVPLLYMYYIFRGDLTGSILFLRHAYLVFGVVCAAVTWLLLRKKVRQLYLSFFVGIPVFSTIGQITNFSYNTMLYLLFYVTCALFYAMTFEKNHLKLKAYAMGLAMMNVLLIIVYPSMIVFSLICLICITFIWGRNKSDLKSVITAYILTGGIVGIAFVIVLCIQSSGINNFIVGVQNIVDNPHKNAGDVFLKGRGKAEVVFIEPLWGMVKSTYGKGLIILLIVNILMKKLHIKEWIPIFCSVIYVGINLLHRSRGVYSDGFVWNYVLLFTVVLIALYLNREEKKMILFSIIIPSISVLLIKTITTAHPNCLLQWGLFAPYLFVLAYIFDKMMKNEQRNKMLFDSVVVVLACMLIGSFVYYFESNIYRDSTVEYLTEKVDTSIYAGIYTTEERKQFVEKVQGIYDTNAKEMDKECLVTVFGHFPWAYIASKGVPYTADSWSDTYRYTTQEQPDLEWLNTFFDIHKKQPDIVYTVEYDGGDYYFGEQSEYNDFLSDNYQIEWEDTVFLDDIQYVFRKYLKAE